ncbi:hypothetical protein JOD29_000611 [Lysinibacillus composti]|uniref:Uncharacterized protein n=1 Tax=Lysinibacillus composti TaxID=720633 RepID=A0A3N9UJC4_9BACI|nr:hypothetical protein [Lysinibacillus composti]MBM7607374.1 hypothetical protein [Lysinibacillus composti]RQW76067.1 hypothetical protein EBB45_00495 [Lysinibacillus composti]
MLFECPEAEWTIEMETIDAAYYYRPVDYAKVRDERQIELHPLQIILRS